VPLRLVGSEMCIRDRVTIAAEAVKTFKTEAEGVVSEPRRFTRTLPVSALIT
jgi:hypothetical protein